MTAILERQPVQYDGEVILEKAIALGSEELRSKARDLFEGVSCRRQEYCRTGDLKKTLVSLQIEPYTAESVEIYKARMERSVSLRNLPSRVLADAPNVFGTCGVIALFVWAIIASVCVTFNLVSMAWWFGAIGLAALASLGTAIGIATLFDHGWLKVRKLKWRSNNLGWAWREIPEFALQTAVDIKTHCPGVHLYVEEAFIEERVVDPFLVAIDHGEKFYLEVWNEPGFMK